MKNTKQLLILLLVTFLTIIHNGFLYGQCGISSNKLFQLKNKVLVAAHRGNWKDYPENSIPGIQSCIGTGIDIIEIDVQRTKDGNFVLMHDASIDRTTNGKGKVSDYTLKELQRFKLKGNGDTITEYQIPTLDTILKITKDKIVINIDKSSGRFKELTNLIDSLNCNNHVLLKGNGPSDYFKNLNNQDTNSIYYMPILSTKSKIDSFLFAYQPPLFELLLGNDSSFYSSSIFLDLLNKQNIKIWYNALFNSISGGHTENVDAINSWNWFINHGAFIIQTDYPFHLVNYLNQLGFHDELKKEGLYDLKALPILDTIASKEKKENVKQSAKNKSAWKYHEIKNKETIYSISRKYHISTKEIYRMNPRLKKTSKLKRGQKLRIR
jgi:glycerophosphoryl diester phosphodiesterase